VFIFGARYAAHYRHLLGHDWRDTAGLIIRGWGAGLSWWMGLMGALIALESTASYALPSLMPRPSAFIAILGQGVDKVPSSQSPFI